MKKCQECNFYMREASIEGQHPFELGVDGRSNIRKETDVIRHPAKW